MTMQKASLSKRTRVKIDKDPHKIKTSFYKTFKEVNDLKSKIEEGRTIFDYGGFPVRAKPSDIIRVVSQKKEENGLSECSKNIILNSLITMEKKSPFSSHAFLNLFENQNSDLWSTKLRAEKHEMLSLVRGMIGTGICYDLFKTVFENAGLFGDVEFKPAIEKNTFEVYTTGGVSYKGNFPMLWKQTVDSLERTKVVFIDGIVEKVSEIHMLLETSSESKESLLILARGFAADVVQTLTENFESGKLRVVPYQITEEHVNELEDKVFTIKSENYREIRSLKFEEIDTVYDVRLSLKSFVLKSEDKRETYSTVLVPKRYLNHLPIIKERFSSAVIYSRQIVKSGIILNGDKNPIYGRVQYETASKTIRQVKKLVDQIGCVVVHSV